MTKNTIDITPHPSLISKLGASGYRTYEAIAELIDNSIDARLVNEPLKIEIKLDFVNRTITVKDNGSGMDLFTLRKAMTLAHTEKTNKKKLGTYGMGLKTACSSLGETLSIRTKRSTENRIFSCVYKEGEWIEGSKKKWSEFPIEEISNTSSSHFTIILIGKLKVSLYRNMVGRFKKIFSIRYGPFLKTKQIEIQINSIKCEYEKPDIIESSKKTFRLKLDDSKIITGWGALLKTRHGDEYGFNLYKNGRLIKMHDKTLFGREPHSAISRIIGDLNLDHVPILYNKTDFIRESDAFSKVEKAFPEYDKYRELKGEATEPYTKKLSDLTFEKIKSVAQNTLLHINNYQKIGYQFPDKFARGKDQHLLTFQLSIYNVDRKIEVYLSYLENVDPYEIKLGNTVKILINQNSPQYTLTRNKTLFINVQIANALSYAVTKIKNLSIEDFLKINNDFTAICFLESKERSLKKKVDKENIKEINEKRLSENLKDINRLLKKEYEEDSYYFTATSVLSGYLTHIPRTNYYFLYCERGLGNNIQTIILRKYGKEYLTLLDPKKLDLDYLENLLKNKQSSKILIIREKERARDYKGDGSVASAEIAIVDLVFEIKKNGLPIPITDVEDMFENPDLVDISKKKLLRYAQFRNYKDVFIEMGVIDDKR